jgi:hypothetical protein
LIFEGGLEDFEKKFPAIQGGKKKYPAAKYIGKKISCAALLQEKNICLAQSEFSSTPPLPQKWSINKGYLNSLVI